MPRVLNLKHTKGVPDGAVYIGRFNRPYRLPRSKWANPYEIGRDGTRNEVIAEYELYLYASGLINDSHVVTCGTGRRASRLRALAEH